MFARSVVRSAAPDRGACFGCGATMRKDDLIRQFRTLDDPPAALTADRIAAGEIPSPFGSGTEPVPIRSDAAAAPAGGRWVLPRRPSIWARFWAWALFGARWTAE